MCSGQIVVDRAGALDDGGAIAVAVALALATSGGGAAAGGAVGARRSGGASRHASIEIASPMTSGARAIEGNEGNAGPRSGNVPRKLVIPASSSGLDDPLV